MNPKPRITVDKSTYSPGRTFWVCTADRTNRYMGRAFGYGDTPSDAYDSFQRDYQYQWEQMIMRATQWEVVCND